MSDSTNIPFSSLATFLLQLEEDNPDGKYTEDQAAYRQGQLRRYTLQTHHQLSKVFIRAGEAAPTGDYPTALYNFFIAACNGGDHWDCTNSPEARELFLHLCLSSIVIEKGKEGVWPPPLSDNVLRQFVVDYLGRSIFTDQDMGKQRKDLLSVFMPVGLGCYDDRAIFELANIGIFYEYLEKAGPRSVNGFPVFFSVRVMSIADAERCLAAIKKQMEVIKEMEV
jgi:hypothetical protein